MQNHETPRLLKIMVIKIGNIGTFELNTHAAQPVLNYNLIEVPKETRLFSHLLSSPPPLSLSSVAEANIIVKFEELSMISGKLIGFLIS